MVTKPFLLNTADVELTGARHREMLLSLSISTRLYYTENINVTNNG